jgi:hypothetical protein
MSKITDLLTKETAGLPNWAWVAVVIVGGGVGYLFVRSNQGSSAGTSTTSADGSTDTSTAGANAVSQPSDTDYSQGLSSGNANGSSPVYVLSTSVPTSTTTTAGTATQQVTIRDRQTTGPSAAYDKTHPQGVPVHSGTSGQTPTVKTVPFASSVTVTGPAVIGAANTGNGQGGTVYWYPVQGGGYISSFDIVGIGGGGIMQPRRQLGL